MLATLIYQFNDMELAEDCLQEAITRALELWIYKVPENPIAWLTRVAKNKAIDKIRRDHNFKDKRVILDATEQIFSNDNQQSVLDEEIPDERLRLIFTCCHPAIPEPTRVALTLKTLCGLTTLQIANAFLIEEKAVAQRLVRAKKKIKIAAIPYKVPSANQWGERVESVMAVAYLIFNEGYHSVSTVDALQIDLCNEGMQIGKTLMQLLPTETEVIGLLALMYFHYARFPSRINKQGESISLDKQDRSLWLQDYIVAGDKLLKAALMKSDLGAYQIQAAISAVHVHTSDFEETDWAQITLLFEKLYQYKPTPVVELNAAVALSFAQSPEAGLVALESIEATKVLRKYQPLYAAKADMLNRAKQLELAKQNYEKAIELTENKADKIWLKSKLDAIIKNL